jgi:uncharacterized protein YukE|tara:strand:- start:185 stop:538 length:354 start_codon:yes stop_codon:yes gene_type:complete
MAMGISRDLQAELEKRDDLILALEMLMVDQACRLLALEAVVVNMAGTDKVKAADVKARIAQESKRFHRHFEGESLSGFIDRSQRIAKQLSKPSKAVKAAKKTVAKVAEKKPVKKTKK